MLCRIPSFVSSTPTSNPCRSSPMSSTSSKWLSCNPNKRSIFFCKSCTLSKIWYKSSLVCSVFVSAACFGSTAFFGLFWVGSIAAASFQILYSLVVPIPKRFRIDAGDSFPRASTISRISSVESFLVEGMFANILVCAEFQMETTGVLFVHWVCTAIPPLLYKILCNAKKILCKYCAMLRKNQGKCCTNPVHKQDTSCFHLEFCAY